MMRMEISKSDYLEVLNRLGNDKILRTAVLDSIALISNRIQQRGIDSNGSKLPPYTPAYAKYRRLEGRQTVIKDLTLTGEMIDGLALERTGENEYSVGFSSKSAADKSQWNEAKFGSVFELTQEEESLVVKSMEEGTNAAIGI